MDKGDTMKTIYEGQLLRDASILKVRVVPVRRAVSADESDGFATGVQLK